MNGLQKPVQGLSASTGDPTSPTPFHSGVVVDSPYNTGGGVHGISGTAGSRLTKGLTSELLQWPGIQPEH